MHTVPLQGTMSVCLEKDLLKFFINTLPLSFSALLFIYLSVCSNYLSLSIFLYLSIYPSGCFNFSSLLSVYLYILSISFLDYLHIYLVSDPDTLYLFLLSVYLPISYLSTAMIVSGPDPFCSLCIYTSLYPYLSYQT